MSYWICLSLLTHFTSYNSSRSILVAANGIFHSFLWLGNKKWFLSIELPYEPAIRLLGIYLGKTIIQKKYMHPMFITPLFTTARTCVHQQMDGKEEVVYIYSGILLNLKKSNIMWFAATWMQLEMIILSEVSQEEKDKYHMISLPSRT